MKIAMMKAIRDFLYRTPGMHTVSDMEAALKVPKRRIISSLYRVERLWEPRVCGCKKHYYWDEDINDIQVAVLPIKKTSLPMVDSKAPRPVRKPTCSHYEKCLNDGAMADMEFDCTNCEKFSELVGWHGCGDI